MSHLYPLVLTQDEIFVLRGMIKITIVNRFRASTETYRKLVRLQAQTPELLRDPGSDETADRTFTEKIFYLLDLHRNMEMPLLYGLVHSKGVQSAIVNLQEQDFRTLKGIAGTDFQMNDSASVEERRFFETMQIHGPGVRAAFEVAEAHSKTSLVQNHPTPKGMN